MLLLVIHRSHAIFPEAAGRDGDIFRERSEFRERHRFVKDFAILGVIDPDCDLLAGWEGRLIFVQVPRDSLQVDDVAGLVNAALREKENRAHLGFFFTGIVGDTEPVKRHGRVAAIDRNEVTVALALGEDPA